MRIAWKNEVSWNLRNPAAEGKLAAPVRNVRVLLSQSGDNISQAREGLVDVLSFLQPLSQYIRFVHPLTAGEINQMKATPHCAARDVFPIHMHSQNTAEKWGQITTLAL